MKDRGGHGVAMGQDNALVGGTDELRPWQGREGTVTSGCSAHVTPTSAPVHPRDLSGSSHWPLGLPWVSPPVGVLSPTRMLVCKPRSQLPEAGVGQARRVGAAPDSGTRRLVRCPVLRLPHAPCLSNVPNSFRTRRRLLPPVSARVASLASIQFCSCSVIPRRVL